MADISITGSDYRLRTGTDGTNTFVSPDGTTLTQDQFVKKVEKKEISLTENSLQFLDSRLGPDTMQSLRAAAGYAKSPSEVLTNLNGVSDTMMGDLFSLLEQLAKITQENKKQMQDVRQSENESQLRSMEDSAKKELESAQNRMIYGWISAGLTIGSGVANLGGSVGSLWAKNPETLMKGVDGIGKALEGTAKGLDGSGGVKSSELEHESKLKDIDAKKTEQMSEETRNTMDTLREMLSKVKETLQAIEQARSQSSQSVARM